MSNPGNDNRLEQLSREAAAGYTPPGNASWEKMEAALDKVMPVEEKKKRRVIFWWLLPFIIIGAGLLYFAWPEPAAIAPAAPVAATIPAPSTPAGTAIPSENSTQVTDGKTSTLAGATNTTDKNIPKSVTTKISMIQHNSTPSKTVVSTVTNSNKEIAISSPDNKTQETPVKQQLQNTAPPVETAQKAADATATKTTIAGTPVYAIQPTVDTGSNKTINSIIEKTDTVIHHQPIDSVQNDPEISKAKKAGYSKFSFALVGGMDASTVKFRYTDKAGINAGFITGFHFNETWSAHTGVLFTRKNYTVAGEDFHAPKGSWVSNYKLSMVDGYCNMWEVPLLVRYQFNGEKKRSFFMSAGLSSYFMTRENYNYSYYWNGQAITRNSNYPNGNTHLFSILRLSAGWRKTIGPGVGILVEPYAALPLGGVGYGSIRLSSFGLNFSLQLRQPNEKK